MSSSGAISRNMQFCGQVMQKCVFKRRSTRPPEISCWGWNMLVDGFWIESVSNTSHLRVYLNPKYQGQQPCLWVARARSLIVCLGKHRKSALSGRSYCERFSSAIPQSTTLIEVPFDRAWFSLQTHATRLCFNGQLQGKNWQMVS